MHRESVRSKVVSIDKSRFDRRQESVRSVSTEITIYQIYLKIFSLAVDKRTKNNQASSLSFYHHFALIQMTFGFDRMNSIETTFDRTDSIPFLQFIFVIAVSNFPLLKYMKEHTRLL